MNQLRVRYHQLKIDMFALYQATMDSRGVKVHRVDQALGEIRPVVSSSHLHLRNEDEDYVQALAEMEKKISVGEHGRRRRHLLRKLNLPRGGAGGGSDEASTGETASACSAEAAPAVRPEAGCRELDRHSNITVLRCYRCTKRFPDKTSLYQHWRDEINCHIVCLFCREEFITNAKHDQHIRLCQALVCGQCKTQCQDYNNYERHICVCPYAAKCEPVEVLTARVQCPYCNRLFTQIHMFKRHLKMMHEVEHMQRFGLKIQRKFRPNEREFPCRQCGRTFNRVYNLKMHQLSHGRTGQYRCETCNKTFRFRSNLERHARSHTGQQHGCRLCSQQFRLVRQLRSHMSLAHEKDKFNCDICQKTCDGYQRLLSHTRTHHSQKSYSCGVCGRSFNTKHKYKEHMNVHEGRYAYECHLCSERFFTRDHLRKHYRKMHPEIKRLPRRAITRRPLEEDSRQPYFETADLGPMINDTVTLYQASADGGSSGGEPSVKFEVVGEGAAARSYPGTADQTSQEMMDGGYQLYEGSEQHVLGEYNSVQEAADAYSGTASAGQCHRTGQHAIQYYQHQVCDGVDGAATLLSLEPAPGEVPEGATVMTYIVPDAAAGQFSGADPAWFGLQPLTTPEKLQRRPPDGEQPTLLFTPDKPPTAARGLFLSPEQAASYHLHKVAAVPVSCPVYGGAASVAGGAAASGSPHTWTPAMPAGFPARHQQQQPLLLPPPPLLRAPGSRTGSPQSGVLSGSPRPSPQQFSSSRPGFIFTSPQLQTPIFISPQQTPILVSMLRENTATAATVAGDQTMLLAAAPTDRNAAPQHAAVAAAEAPVNQHADRPATDHNANADRPATDHNTNADQDLEPLASDSADAIVDQVMDPPPNQNAAVPVRNPFSGKGGGPPEHPRKLPMKREPTTTEEVE